SAASSGSATTTAANELIFGAGAADGAFTAAGTGFTQRQITSYGDLGEDEITSSAGSYSATGTTVNGGWVMQMASFMAAGQTTPPAAPTNLKATGGSGQVALSWNASSGATSYNVKRSTTNGGPYTTISSPTTTSYTDTGLTNGTTYYYVVTA